MTPAFRVCFVCTGNICRSPTAAALLADRARARGLVVAVDSCGISAEEVGNPADPGAVAEASRRGLALGPHRARALAGDDFRKPGWLVGMTAAHVRALARRRPPPSPAEVHLLLDFAAAHVGQDVPDPWYGDGAAFAHAFELVAVGVDGLVGELESRGLGGG